MIKQEIYLANWDWYVKIYYAVDRYYVNEILNDLVNIKCNGEDLTEAQHLLLYGEVNTGFTYSSYDYRTSIVVIGITTSADEFQNTFDHEKGHVAMHIAKYLDIEPFSEEYQYLAGDIGIKMFKIAKHFLCNKCRKDLLKYV